MQPITIVIHGGAGTIEPADLTPQLEQQYHEGLQAALDAAYAILINNGTALDAVAVAVSVLEDNPLFNAGRGSVFTNTGAHEMDASIMEGKDLKAGAVAGVQHIKNPILVAKTVMEKTEHIFLGGEAATTFALNNGFEHMPDEYFYTEHRYRQWQLVKEETTVALDHNIKLEKKFGTVGAAAVDINGNIAAATSTGGMTNKRYGRIGDTPMIGAGTYANNNTCAISCTGHGEKFIQAVAAYDVSCLMEYKNMSLEQAMKVVVEEKLVKIEGEGGMIGVDANGNYAMIFNSAGMYRGVKNNVGINQTAIYR